ncbi:MAG: glycosyltransferase [Anaerolineae bacterium]|nr:glycosyltransferase [Phycisphaerae bacterium]
MSVLWLERSIAMAYALIGPVIWVGFLFGMIKGRRRLSLLSRPLWDLPDRPPRASVLVPIKDEAHQLRACMASVLAVDYPDLQIIAIDDRSTDGTGKILDELAAQHSRLQVIHIRPGDLPAGWVGKPHALHVGMQHASGEWLLFVDSDMQLAPDSLRATIGLAEIRRFDLISLLPRLENQTFWERLIVPLGAAATSAMFLLPMTNYNELPNIAFANGQFMLIRRRAYDAIGGHASVRGLFSEDIGIAKALKRAGFRPRLAIGSEFASTRMYNSLRAVLAGWSRNFFGGSGRAPWKMLAGIFFVLACSLSAFAAIAWGIYRARNPITELGGEGWIAIGIVHWIIMTFTLAVNYAWTGNPKRYALLFPLGAIMLIGIWLRALWMCVTRRVEWRGTQYAPQSSAPRAPVILSEAKDLGPGEALPSRDPSLRSG